MNATTTTDTQLTRPSSAQRLLVFSVSSSSEPTGLKMTSFVLVSSGSRVANAANSLISGRSVCVCVICVSPDGIMRERRSRLSSQDHRTDLCTCLLPVRCASHTNKRIRVQLERAPVALSCCKLNLATKIKSICSTTTTTEHDCSNRAALVCERRKQDNEGAGSQKASLDWIHYSSERAIKCVRASVVVVVADSSASAL